MPNAMRVTTPAVRNGRQPAALAVAGEVGRRLRDPDILAGAIDRIPRQSSYPAAHRWRTPFLSTGSLSIALLCAELDRVRPREGWDRAGHQCLSAATQLTAAGDPAPLGLFHGLGGLGAAAWLLSRNGTRYRRLLEELDGWTLPRLRAAAAGIATRGTAQPAEHDLITGLCGSAASLMLRPRTADTDTTLVAIAGALVRLLGPARGPHPLLTPPDLVSIGDRADYPHGYVSCGLAHGVPGPLALLALLRLGTDLRVAGLDDAIGHGAEWLLAQAIFDDAGLTWPTVVVPDPLTRVFAPGPVTARSAWCYGPPGVARALWLAGRALDHAGWRDTALAAMAAVCRRPVVARRLSGPGLCHGVAGLLLIVHLFAAETGDLVLRREADRLRQELIAGFRADTLLGYQDVETSGAVVDNPGLLNGAAGVALALLAATAATPPDWTRLFLLA